MPTVSKIPLYTTVCDKPPPPGTAATRTPAERAAELARREALRTLPDIPATSTDIANDSEKTNMPSVPSDRRADRSA